MADTLPLVGNLTADPELRFTASGTACVRFSVAKNRRWQNKQTQEWEEETDFFDCVMWAEAAENFAQSLHKGDRVLLIGEFRQNRWETDDGDKRSKIEFLAAEGGPSTRWATAEVTRTERKGGNGSSNGRRAPEPAGAAQHGATTTTFAEDEEPF